MAAAEHKRGLDALGRKIIAAAYDETRAAELDAKGDRKALERLGALALEAHKHGVSADVVAACEDLGLGVEAARLGVSTSELVAALEEIRCVRADNGLCVLEDGRTVSFEQLLESRGR